MKIYVASSWRNSHQPTVVDILRKYGHDVYDFRNPPNNSGFSWSEVTDGSNMKDGKISAYHYREILRHSRSQKGYESDITALRNCDAIVFVLPCGRSASWEFGYAMGQMKRGYVLWLDNYEPELMFMEAEIIGTLAELEEIFSREY